MRRRMTAAMGVLTGLGAFAATTLSGTAASTAVPAASVHPLAHLVSHTSWTSPPTHAECRATRHGRDCFRPSQFQTAYHMTAAYRKGWTGKGTTIVIVDAFGSPTIKHDLTVFDKAFGLPGTTVDVIRPAGNFTVDINDPDQGGWGEETTLDVEYAHAMAPGAKILLVETPVAETEGLVGIPQIVRAENYVVKHHLGDVISQSFGATEDTFPNAQSILRQRSAFVHAAEAGIPVLASSGDAGVVDSTFSGNSYYTHRVNSWPSSDPLVTSVGGTQLRLTAAGHRTAPDYAWNQVAYYQDAVGGGGGPSHVFARPNYQDRVASVVGKSRGTPDISLAASTDGGALTYIGYTSTGAGITPGWYAIGGTSLASPLFSGVVAVAEQAAGQDLGPLNPKLYALAASSSPAITDVTHGDNGVTFTQDGMTYTVPGFPAVPGYDMSTGVGSPNGSALAAAFAK